MKVVGIISLFDEPIDWVEESVKAACRLCDHMVVVDGAFERYPHDSAVSSPEMMEAVVRGAGHTPMTTVQSEVAWPSQAAKMGACFNLVEAFTEMWMDWMFVFAADEIFQCKPRLLRKHLWNTDSDQIFVPFHTVQPEHHTMLTRRRFTYPDDDRKISRILRVHKHMRVEPPTHWRWTGENENGKRVALHGAGKYIGLEDGVTESLPEEMCSMTHYTLLRDPVNMRRKARYMASRARTHEDL